MSEGPWLVNRLIDRACTHFSFLYLAAENGSVEVAKILIEAGANVNQQCVGGNTPLYIASCNGHAEVVALLLSRPDIVVDLFDDIQWTPLHNAIRDGHTGIVEQLLDAKASVHSVTSNSTFPLGLAAYGGNLPICRLLLQHNADVHARDGSGDASLFSASLNGHEEIMMLLLAAKAVPHAPDEQREYKHNSLHMAACQGLETVAVALLEANAVVDMGDEENQTALVSAAMYNRAPVVRHLLRAGANPNHLDDEERAALHHSCIKGYASVVNELVNGGADLSLVDGDGRLPLTTAARNGHEDCLQSLLIAKADLNAIDGNGHTAFVAAIRHGKLATAAFLVAKGFTRPPPHLLRKAVRGTPYADWFACRLCGPRGRCCRDCRQTDCATKCIKYTGSERKSCCRRLSHRPMFITLGNVDCRKYVKIAHQSLLEWTLAMSALRLPPYVLEHIFDCLHDRNDDCSSWVDYGVRTTTKRIALSVSPPTNDDWCYDILFGNEDDYIHLILHERTHVENIKMFISVHHAMRKKDTKNE